MAGLIPIPEDFEECVQFAVDQDDKARNVVDRAVERGLDRVYMVGCGGSHFGMYPAFDLLDRYGTAFTTQRLTSAELTSRNPAGLDEHALVIAASHSGATPETVEAARFAKAKGATVAAISRVGENPLGTIGDVHLDYPDTITITEPKLVHTEDLAVALLEATGEGGKIAAVKDAIPALPRALHAVKEEAASPGERTADVVADAGLTYVVAGGAAYGMAKMMALCYFEEMQWMNAAAINAGDFFHGPLEMIAKDTPMVVLMAEDVSRPLGERVARFAGRYTDVLSVVDTTRFSLPGVSAEARPDLSVVALMSGERRVLDHVAARRGHDTSVRHYMYKVEY